jgi:hypothetical protein
MSPASPILDQFGQPVSGGPTPSISIDPNTRVYVDECVAKAVGDVRDNVEKKWRRLNLLSWLVTAVFGFTSLELWLSIPGKVKEQLVEPKVVDTVNRVIQEKAVQHIDREILPLKASADGLRENVKIIGREVAQVNAEIGSVQNTLADTSARLDSEVKEATLLAERLRDELSQKQKELDDAQRILGHQVRISTLATAAKEGSSLALMELENSLDVNDPRQTAARAALKEIEFFYDNDARQLFVSKLVDPVSRENPGFAIEEMLMDLFFDTNPKIRIAAANTISEQIDVAQAKGIIGVLVKSLRKEHDLRVKARIIKLINKICKVEFKPLYSEEVIHWWRVHQYDTEYVDLYSEFIDSQICYKLRGLKFEALRMIQIAINKKPEAIFARCTKVQILMEMRDYARVDRELIEIAKIDPKNRWYLLQKAASIVREGRVLEGKVYLTAALAKSPSVAEFVRSLPIYRDLKPLLPGVQNQFPSLE